MSDSVADTIKYYDGTQKVISEADRTTQGMAEPEEYRELDISSIASDGHDFANEIFMGSKPRILAEVIGLGIIFDDTQAGCRLAEVYGRTRADYYRIASETVKARNSHTKFKRSVTIGMINSSKPVKEALSLE